MSVSMRRSRVLARFRRGEVVSCMKLNFADPRVAEMGYQLITPGSDAIALKAYWEQLTAELQASPVFRSADAALT